MNATTDPFAKINAALDADTPDPAVTVGMEFTAYSERPWHRGAEHGVHRRTVLNRVTSVDDIGFTYDTVSVVSEQDRPQFAGYPINGVISWFGWANATARGDMVVQS